MLILFPSSKFKEILKYLTIFHHIIVTLERLTQSARDWNSILIGQSGSDNKWQEYVYGSCVTFGVLYKFFDKSSFISSNVGYDTKYQHAT